MGVGGRGIRRPTMPGITDGLSGRLDQLERPIVTPATNSRPQRVESTGTAFLGMLDPSLNGTPQPSYYANGLQTFVPVFTTSARGTGSPMRLINLSTTNSLRLVGSLFDAPVGDVIVDTFTYWLGNAAGTIYMELATSGGPYTISTSAVAIPGADWSVNANVGGDLVNTTGVITSTAGGLFFTRMEASAHL